MRLTALVRLLRLLRLRLLRLRLLRLFAPPCSALAGVIVGCPIQVVCRTTWYLYRLVEIKTGGVALETVDGGS